jgi:hypothetical protein
MDDKLVTSWNFQVKFNVFLTVLDYNFIQIRVARIDRKTTIEFKKLQIQLIGIHILHAAKLEFKQRKNHNGGE